MDFKTCITLSDKIKLYYLVYHNLIDCNLVNNEIQVGLKNYQNKTNNFILYIAHFKSTTILRVKQTLVSFGKLKNEMFTFLRDMNCFMQ